MSSPTSCLPLLTPVPLYRSVKWMVSSCISALPVVNSARGGIDIAFQTVESQQDIVVLDLLHLQRTHFARQHNGKGIVDGYFLFGDLVTIAAQTRFDGV